MKALCRYQDTAVNKRDEVAFPNGTYSVQEDTELNICMYIYIYIYRDREREREREIHSQRVIQIKISAVKKKHRTFRTKE